MIIGIGKIMLFCNIIIIPLTLLIAPFFIDFSQNMIDGGYYFVNDEGDRKLDELSDQASWIYYVMPPIMTNIIVFTTIKIFDWYYGKEYKPKQNRVQKTCFTCGVPIKGNDIRESEYECGFCADKSALRNVSNSKQEKY